MYCFLVSVGLIMLTTSHFCYLSLFSSLFLPSCFPSLSVFLLHCLLLLCVSPPSPPPLSYLHYFLLTFLGFVTFSKNQFCHCQFFHIVHFFSISVFIVLNFIWHLLFNFFWILLILIHFYWCQQLCVKKFWGFCMVKCFEREFT